MDPQYLVLGGSVMVEEIEKQTNLLSHRPYIFNLGHGIVPETPFKNVQLALETLDRICK